MDIACDAILLVRLGEVARHGVGMRRQHPTKGVGEDVPHLQCL